MYVRSAAGSVVSAEDVKEIKEQMINYFMTCFQCPETIDLNNNNIE